MKRHLKSEILTVGIVGLITACGSLLSSDTLNKQVLNDVATQYATDATLAAQFATSPDASGTPTAPPPPSCGKNPLLEACLADAKTFCASSLPPAPGSNGTVPVGQQSFEHRHDRMHDLLSCLQTNETSLSSACQTALANVPTEHGCHRGGHGPDGHRHGPGEGRPEGCHGQSPLAACIGDAKTLCSAELPTPEEVENLSPEDRKARVEAIVSCLNGQLSSVSADCQTALTKWEADHPATPAPAPTATTAPTN